MQMQQPPPPPKPQPLGPEDLELAIDALEKEIPNIDAYTLKLQIDRTNLGRRLTMLRDNLRYMRRHEGTITLEHYRKLKIEIKKTIEMIRNNDNDIDKFDKAKENTNKRIAMMKLDLEQKWAIEEQKILQFSRKSDVEQS